MRSLLIFNQQSDLVYINCCTQFVKHVCKLAAKHGLVSSEHSTLYSKGKKALDPNILIQLFLPIVTSHRLMKEQFGNPYTSVQCEDGVNMVFNQYMGFLFLRIGNDEVSFLRRSLHVSITLITYICGPDIGLLKASEYHSNLLDTLIGSWARLFFTDQTFLVDAVEQMLVNIQLSSSLIKSLQNAATTLQSSNNPPGNQVHALLLMGTKLLSLYSTKTSKLLTSEDILFLIILCQSTRRPRKRFQLYNKGKVVSKNRNTNGTYSIFKSSSQGNSSTTSDELTDSCDSSDYEDENYYEDMSPSPDAMKHYCILLKNGLNFVAHRVHIEMLHNGLYFVIICETGSSNLLSQVSTGLQLAHQFNDARHDNISKDKQYYEQLDSITKKLLDLLKKQKCLTIRNELSICWDRFKSKFNQYLKTKDLLHLQINPLLDMHSKLFRIHFSKKECFKGVVLNDLELISNKIQFDTQDFLQFLQVKVYGNSILEAKDTLTINKYLEEFPGLVHFIYIDRTRHCVSLPTLNFSQDNTVKLTKQKIWMMVKFGREHVQQGHFSILWKDNAFSYAYFLWFEDPSGQPIAPKVKPELPWDDCPLPGILCGDFYKRLLIESFPLTAKIKCLELFCIHLGLATSSCVLGHSKRLASTICEVTGGNAASVLL